MSKRNAGRRGRPRKRRPAQEAGAETTTTATDPPVEAAPPARARPARERNPRRASAETRPTGAHRDPGGVGERPQAPWHPWPFSELLIFVGAVGTIVGFAKAESRVLYAGLGAVVLGTLEFTLREHRAGYRSHASLLAIVPTALVHGGVALGIFALGGRGAVLVLAPLAIDVPLFWLLFRFLRVQFEEARRERVFALRQR